MKKISSIKQLRPEKKRLLQHQSALENKMRGNWDELKESIKPSNIAKDAFSRMIRNKTRENLGSSIIIKGALSIGAALLAKRVADRAGKKLSRLFKR